MRATEPGCSACSLPQLRGRQQLTRRTSLRSKFQLHTAHSTQATHLDRLWRRVVAVVVRLVVLVPLVAGVHPVEVLWAAGAVLLVPPVHLRLCVQGHLAAKRSVPRGAQVSHHLVGGAAELALPRLLLLQYRTQYQSNTKAGLSGQSGSAVRRPKRAGYARLRSAAS